MKIKKISNIEDKIKDLELVRHGGCSKIYIEPDDNDMKYCWKIFRDRISSDTKKIILENNIKLASNIASSKKNTIILPESIYVDSNNELIAQVMQNYKYHNMQQCKKLYFNKKEYIKLVSNFMKEIREISKLGIIISDLKETNVLITDQMKPLLIDNDFTFKEKDKNLINLDYMVKGLYGEVYKEVYNPKMITKDYNDYVAMCMVSVLLLGEEKMLDIKSPRNRFTLNDMKNMQYYLQKDKSLSMNLRKSLKNITTGNDCVKIDDYLINEVTLALEYRAKHKKYTL